MDELELIKVDLDYIKNLPAPPQAIKDTMEAVTLLLGYPPRQARVSLQAIQLFSLTWTWVDFYPPPLFFKLWVNFKITHKEKFFLHYKTLMKKITLD